MAMLTIEQVMTELGIASKTTIDKYRKAGDIKFVDIAPSGSRRPLLRCDSRELERFKTFGSAAKQQPGQKQPTSPNEFRSSRGRRTVIR